VLTLLASTGIFMVKHAGGGRGYALGRQILAFVAHHPTCDRVTYDTVSAFLQQHNLPQEETRATTVDALIAALQAELVTGAEISTPLPATQSPQVGLTEPLTSREMEVVRLLAAGYSNAEIARKLVVAIGTVKAHTSSIYRKLDVATRGQAIARLHSLGLLE
jgi:ATP/maltotriose-dependent transcriptional regulator MalT